MSKFDATAMKLYTDFTGKFQMFIPVNWEYKNPSLHRKVEEGIPQAFGFYDKTLGAFQISCKKITQHIHELIERRKQPIQSSDEDVLTFSEQLGIDGERHMHMFSCAVDDHFFFATYSVIPKKNNIKKIEGELAEVRKVLMSVKFIKEPYRDIILTQRRFDLYMSSIAAIIDLKNKAVERNSYIEYVVFSANHIDALLRLSIILNNQLANKNEDIDLTLLFQAEGDRPIFEKQIYQQCFGLKIISDILFRKLTKLYNERNKVIHRYIITDIRTEDIHSLAMDYQEIFNEIDAIINSLEQKQVEMQIGIWKNAKNEDAKEQIKQLLEYKVKDKHGNLPK